jgi:hypothetical protein
MAMSAFPPEIQLRSGPRFGKNSVRSNTEQSDACRFLLATDFNHQTKQRAQEFRLVCRFA